MAVSNLQTWADNLEYIRIPAIKSDIADLTAAQAVYASELSAKAQEFTDRLDAHDARITAAQTDATSASVAASAVSTEVYGARLDATTYTNQKHQEALDAIQASNTDIKNYLDSGFASYLQNLIADSDNLLSAEVTAALNEAFNAKNALNQELIDIGLINDQLLDQEVPAINQDLQDSLIRLVGLEYFNEAMFGGMQFPDIQALHDKLAGEVQDATDIAEKAANDPEIRKLINQAKIDNAILAAQNVSNSGHDVVSFEESGNNTTAILTESTTRAAEDSALANQINAVSANVGDNAAAIVTEQTARVSADSAIASDVTSLASQVDNDLALVNQTLATKVDSAGAIAAVETEVSASYNGLTAMASATQSAKATTDGIQSGFAWRLNGSNVMEMFSISDGSGGIRKTAKLDFNYVQITGLTQIDSAVITDLVADNAFIDNLAVDTFNIAGNAATVGSFSDLQSQIVGDGTEKFVVSSVISVPANSTADIFIAASFSHGYPSGTRNWGFSLAGGPIGSLTSLASRSNMTFGNDYPVVTYIDTYTNTGSSAQDYLVWVYWTGEDSGIILNSGETNLSLVARWR